MRWAADTEVIRRLESDWSEIAESPRLCQRLGEWAEDDPGLAFENGTDLVEAAQSCEVSRWSDRDRVLAALLDRYDDDPLARRLAARGHPTGDTENLVGHGEDVLGQLDGALPALMPPAHTRWARDILGPSKYLGVVMPALLAGDQRKGVESAVGFMDMYLNRLTPYRTALLEHGSTVGDFEDGLSDPLIDATVTIGSAERIAARVVDHLNAGADHVAVMPITKESYLMTLESVAKELEGEAV